MRRPESSLSACHRRSRRPQVHESPAGLQHDVHVAGTSALKACGRSRRPSQQGEAYDLATRQQRQGRSRNAVARGGPRQRTRHLMTVDLACNNIGAEARGRSRRPSTRTARCSSSCRTATTSTRTTPRGRPSLRQQARSKGARVDRLSGRQVHRGPRTPRRAAVICGARSTDIPA